MKKIFIIIPAYNEDENVVDLLSSIKNIKLIFDKKVILVDDGSTDKTKELAMNFKNQMDLEILVHAKNLGVPRTFFDGITAACVNAEDDDIVLIMEADNTSKLSLMPEMIEKINLGSDIVIGSRYIAGGSYKNFPLYRTIGSNVVNSIVKLLVHLPNVTDYSIFYRAYRAEILKKALAFYGNNFITTNSFAANLEILLKLRKFVKKIDECPLVYNYGLKKGKSKMNLIKTLKEYGMVINKFKK
ncbi:MAG: hypothetical protein COU51_04050 [Parcubacteria group bacterium CG10_big_fil_rev_8_21_14_0_10_36_14]|nr:MAG: hypothetical protein COU51_04050 [Parcubacteria group bacterium CG10_big_fil_rev_8_21_14_0_10_36_14]